MLSQQSAQTVIDIRSLTGRMSGTVVTPADAEWDAGRLAWALAVDQRPAAVALPESAADVVAIVSFARANGLRVAAQGTGHNAHPLEDALDETILVKTERMHAVAIDPHACRARVQAGAIWADVTHAAGEHGLAPLAGSSPDVGVVGYTLGGGLSWLSRRHGLAANSVAAIELVTADGRLVRADRVHEPDLFWALRGGGGSFGVVTAMELELLPLREVYAGAAFFPQERAAEVLHSWREWTRGDLPDDIMSAGRLMNFPPLPEVPEPVRGRSFVVVEAVYLGDEHAGARLVEPLRALGPQMDTFATIPTVALSHLHMDPEQPVPGKGDGMLIDGSTRATIDALVDVAGPGSGSTLLSVELRQLGGALARPEPAHGALDSLDGEYALFAVGMTPTPELRALTEDRVTRVKEALTPWDAGHAYLNFAERRVDPRRLFAREYTYRRLQQVKAAYDPADMFQSNHPIAPAS